MNKGINLYCYSGLGECDLETSAALMKENGFTKTFWMSDAGVITEKNASLLLQYGIAFDTLHAPFNTINDIWKNDDSGEYTLKQHTNGIDKCVEVGAPTLIVHLSSGCPEPKITDAGNRRFDALMEYARKKNVKIAYENQRYVGNLAYVLEQYDDAGFCWDAGHEGCFTPGKRFMPILGDRLCALHLSDNHCEKDKDEHMLPYDGTVDYDRVALSIAENGYEGTLMLEVLRGNSPYYTNVTAEEYYHLAGNAAKRLDETIAEIKKNLNV